MTGSGLSGLLAVSGMRLGEVIRLDRPDLYYSRSFTKGYRSWPSVADLDRQETTHSDDRGLTRAGTIRM
jgi:hypothetical protein